MPSALLHAGAGAALTLLLVALGVLVDRAAARRRASAEAARRHASEDAAALDRLRRRAGAVIAAAQRSAVPLDFTDELYALASDLRSTEVPRG